MSETERNKGNRRFAELLDSKFRIPKTNIRFGIDPVIGLVPGVGDWLAGVVSLYFLIQAAVLGGKVAILGRMFINILLDIVIGTIPVFGEIFDIYWKANLRNARILDELQQNPAKTKAESRLWIWFVVIQFVVLIIGVLLLISWLIAEIFGLIF
jgi:NAD/NADP transhydrogenase beta subunit